MRKVPDSVITILLVDDDELVRATIESSLSERGCTVITAENGREAMAQLERTTSIDVIVCDILMPEMDGLETLRELRMRWSMIPVVIMSGGDRSGWNDALRMAALLGANRTIQKPFTPRQLLDVIDDLLKESKRG